MIIKKERITYNYHNQVEPVNISDIHDLLWCKLNREDKKKVSSSMLDHISIRTLLSFSLMPRWPLAKTPIPSASSFVIR